jgi:hypothetical protein
MSAREVGRNAAGGEPAAFAGSFENKGAAVCTPGLGLIMDRKYN